MNIRFPKTGVLLASTLAAGVVSGCAATQPGNAPEPVYAECQKEAGFITGRQREATRSLMEGPEESSAQQAIKDARAGHAEAEATGLAAWPEDALIARCLVNNGITLTPEQEKTLEEWQERTKVED